MVVVTVSVCLCGCWRMKLNLIFKKSCYKIMCIISITA